MLLIPYASTPTIRFLREFWGTYRQNKVCVLYLLLHERAHTFAGADAIPDELVDAARMDGAGPLRFLREILIPVSAANIAAPFVILFVYGWNQYLWPLLVATDPGLDTIVIGIVKIIGVETRADWSAVMATAFPTLLPPMIVVALMQRWFVAGSTDGGK